MGEPRERRGAMADPPVAWGGRAQGDEELPDLASFDAEDQKKIAKIQAVQRGRMARKQAPLKRVETAQGSVVVESTPEELEAAAIKIQARNRGRRARADLAKMKQSSKAKTAREEEVKGVVRLIVTGLMQFPQFQGGVRIADAFAVNDSDRDGSVTETELRNSLVGYGVDVAPHKAALLFEEMDKDADGSVTIIEFSKLLTKYAPEMMALNETSVPEISGMGHRLYTYNDVFKYLQKHGLLVTFNEMIAFIVSMRPTVSASVPSGLGGRCREGARVLTPRFPPSSRNPSRSSRSTLPACCPGWRPTRSTASSRSWSSRRRCTAGRSCRRAWSPTRRTTSTSTWSADSSRTSSRSSSSRTSPTAPCSSCTSSLSGRPRRP